MVIKRSLFLWNSMIQASARNGSFAKSLHLYSSMLRTGVHGDRFTFPFIAKACAKLNALRDGVKVHAHVLLMGFQWDVFVQTALIDMYSKCSNLAASRQVFDEMLIKSVVSWNSIISAYSRQFRTEESVLIFKQMQILDVIPSSSTFVSLLSGCAGSVCILHQGLSIHCFVIKFGFGSSLLVSNALMSMYVRYDQVDIAHSVFNSMEERSNVSWTTIIGGYLRLSDFGEVFMLFNKMRGEHISPDSIAFVNLLSSCAQIGSILLASSIHALIIKSGCDHEEMVASSLVSMYSKCGDLISAKTTFSLVHEKGVSLWTSMIGGYALSGNASEAISLYENLLTKDVQPNEVTIAVVLSACADLGSLSIGKKVEQYAKARGFGSNLQVQTSLIDMYYKCGYIEEAKQVFDGVSNKDVAVWSSMITGYAVHGKGEEALALFEDMQRDEGLKPDAIIYTSVLSACSHSGLTKEGYKYFYSMYRNYGIEPSMEHYSCLIDLLGRAGHFSLALKLIHEIPLKACAQAWVPLLSACRTHCQLQIGEYVSRHLFELDPSGIGNYILMAAMYSTVGKWKEAEEIRRLMNDKGLVKEPGWSMIEVDGLSNIFLVGDRSHGRSVEIYEKLEDLNRKLGEARYVVEAQCMI